VSESVRIIIPRDNHIDTRSCKREEIVGGRCGEGEGGVRGAHNN
jgi:hypothetical protein